MKLKAIPAAALFACTLSLSSQAADWAVSPDPTVVRALPSDSRVQAQNPPGFSWPQYSTKPAEYTLKITGPKSASGPGPEVRVYPTRNWYLPSALMAAGDYTWQVAPGRPLDNSPLWSAPRAFSISAQTSVSMPFVVPDTAVIQANVLSHARPRGLTPENLSTKQWSAAMAAERGPLLTRLSAEVLQKRTTLVAPSDAMWPLAPSSLMTSALSAQMTSIRWTINDVTRQLEAASLLFRLTGSTDFLTEAVTRGKQLAALSPTGPTSFANQDQGSRQITLGLAKAIDYLGTSLDPTVKKQWLNVITVRTTDMYNDIAGVSGRLDQQPFDSHGATNLGILTLVATLTLGDIPAATDWFNYSFRAYVHSMSPWSGSEGGFANGTAYAQYSSEAAVQVWPTLAAASGVDLFNKPWSVGFVRFLAQFVPPGSPTHVFGDQHEVVPDVPTLKSFASRVASPAAAWYVNNMVGTEDTLRALSSKWPMPASTVAPVAPPDVAYVPSIGWAAMHSSLSDRKRTSVYFKSSPYGSYSHSHGDQNSLVVNSGGVQLLMEAGYSDWYGSPMWNDWYHQTKSHNAITFDGGKGQKVDGIGSALSWNGYILQYLPKSATQPYDFVSGDATAAYAGVLDSAVRNVWRYTYNYLAPNTTTAVPKNFLVVQDKLKGSSANSQNPSHSYEWNFHTPGTVTSEARGGLRITNGTETLCLRPVTSDMSVQQLYKTMPSLKPEYHGAFIKPAATSAEFLMVVDIGCTISPTSISLTTVGATRTLKVGPATLSLTN